MLQQPDNIVEGTNREDIVATNFILSRQIFQRSTVENQEKFVATNSKDKSSEEMSRKI